MTRAWWAAGLPGMVAAAGLAGVRRGLAVEVRNHAGGRAIRRARLHARERRRSAGVSGEMRARLMGQFMQACASGGLRGFEVTTGR